LDKLLRPCLSSIRRAFGPDLPKHALILGSGFEEVPDTMRIRARVPYEKLPGFPVPKVEGHPGELLFAEVNSQPLLVCCGRAHYYEGASMEQVMFPTRALAEAGVQNLIMTNAAGGINPRFQPGEFMLFSDHINFTGVNPLRGLPIAGGKCFVSLGDAYSAQLRRGLQTAARREKIKLHDGVYLCVAGPSYETPAEIRAFRALGADAVGMSTVPEVLMARYCGLEVAAFSCITNHAAGMSAAPLSHEEVLAVGRESARRAARLFQAFARTLAESAIDGEKV
jgi:purine-nucleoside phosphorylase